MGAELEHNDSYSVDGSERADASSSYQQVKYGTALDQAIREKGKPMVSCTEALQQLQEAQRIQRSTRQTGTPMQLMQQYHPAEAVRLSDRLQKAQMEDQADTE